MAIKINYNELPKGPETIEEGTYLLEVQEVAHSETKAGHDAFVFKHKFINMPDAHDMNDYILINNPDGTPHNFGRRKLRTLLEATKTDVAEITPKVLNQLMKGKRFKARLTVNDNGFPTVNYDDYFTEDSSHEVLNAEPKEDKKEEKVSPEVEEATKSFMKDEDDDI